ncbi:hypothetical protein Poly51_09140 [Rubripirellula tenax]|uniref:SnoaL-like domain protein n=1 Tax=Rubripirellula tenax TaxID=2528015 RepID=A0A5C6FIK9_9BACT|nr:nuclear transport factor 2 family protein [Rubripirellula tenax]TWU60635.1 hypothetical protein Poly51_09140 [Rubripirellula tenax]
MSIVPPFNQETAIAKIRMAEDAWNTRNAEKVSMAYSVDTQWRNRSAIFSGRDAVCEFLTIKWSQELEYRLVKELWAFGDNRIAVRFQYEYRNEFDAWFRAYGNENWQFNPEGLMEQRQASINDIEINETDRKFFWDAPGPRPADHPGLTELGM